MRTIEDAPTSIVAFLGRARRGPLSEPTLVTSYAEFDARFGGLWPDSALGFVVRDFFLNGGTQAIVVRLAHAGAEESSDALPLTARDFLPERAEDERRGLYALERVFAAGGLFNLLCIPPYTASGDVDGAVIDAAALYCERRRAMLLIDAPSAWTSVEAALDRFNRRLDFTTRSRNAAAYFPRVLLPNPFERGRPEAFPASGAVAGVFARTDATRGVWKAPAGPGANLFGGPGLVTLVRDDAGASLNRQGLNCLRSFPGQGVVVWGARTLHSDVQPGSEYKYVPVRRLALFIEESVVRGLQWVLYEPNGEPLWSEIGQAVGAFMDRLFRRGAVQGRTPRDAYFVRCDRTTMTQADIENGIVTVEIGFAPARPGEFVILRVEQIASARG